MKSNLAEPLLDGDGLQLPEKPRKPGDESDEVQAVINNINTLSSKMQTLSKMVELIGTSSDSREHRQKIKSLRSEMQELTRVTQSLLHQYKPPKDQKAKRDKVFLHPLELLRETCTHYYCPLGDLTNLSLLSNICSWLTSSMSFSKTTRS